jgi:hypothetical protein
VPSINYLCFAKSSYGIDYKRDHSTRKLKNSRSIFLSNKLGNAICKGGALQFLQINTLPCQQQLQ